MIYSIQLLRAVAALMVLGFHSAYMANVYGGYQFEFGNGGAAGVDLFFVISGFIITYVTRDGSASRADFLLRRLIRIAPPYWFYSSVTVAILLALPSAFSQLKFDLQHVLLSYLFLLSFNNAHTVGTVLGVGWSICYEMYFYVLFAVFLALPRRAAMLGMAVVIITGALLANRVLVPPFASVMFSVLPLEFLAGCVLAQCYLQGWRLPFQLALVAIVLGGLSIVGASMIDVVTNGDDPWRVLYFGVPALTICAGCLSLETRIAARVPRLLLAIGDASYSLYLSHQFVLYAIGKSWRWAGLHWLLPAWSLMLLVCAAATITALLAYRGFELPLMQFLNRQWRKGRPVLTVARQP